MSVLSTRPFLLTILLGLLLSVALTASAAPASVSIGSDINLSEPKVSLLKFATLFMSGALSLSDESLLTVSVTNPNDADTKGALRLSLDFGGRELGFVQTAPITISPGTSTWSVRSGGSGNNLAVDASHSSGGSVEGEWQVTNWGGDESWLKANIFDWTSMGSAVDIVDQIRALEIPSGSYSLNVSLRYTDPVDGSQQTARHSISWTVLPSKPVRLVAPDSSQGSFPRDGIAPAEIEFAWELPDLPIGIETTSTLTVTDDLSRRRVAEVEIQHRGGYGDTFTHVMRSHGLRTGRAYTWSLNFVNEQTGQTIGGKVPSARFWLENEAPEIVGFDVSVSELIAGESASFAVDYQDDGDERRDLKVAWYLDNVLQSSGRDRFEVTFPPRTSADGVVEVHAIRVEVTDRFGATTERTHTVAVQANRPPVFEIVDPDTRLFKLGSRATFGVTAAGVSDPDGDNVSRLDWYESARSASGDGARIGSGETVDALLNNEGERRITLVAEDGRGGIARESVEITVAANQAPVVSILDLTENMALMQGASLDLAAIVSDDFDDNLDVQFDVNGRAVADGAAFTFNDPGPYLIRAWATDSDNLRGEARVLVTVNGSFNPAPAVRIAGCVSCSDAPPLSEFSESASHQTIRDGQSVHLFATIDEDADAVSWQLNGRTLSSSTAGVAVDTDGSVHRLTLSELPQGSHTVVVSAERDGAVGAARGRVDVGENHAPEIAVDGLAPQYTEGDQIQFTVDASDPDGDEIQEFRWELTGPGGVDEGRQRTVTVDEAVLGTYTLEAFAIDALGRERTHRLSFTVSPNSAPRLTILEPRSGAVIEKDQPVAFRVQVEDPDDDAISVFRISGTQIEAASRNGNVVTLTRSFDESGPLTLEVEATDARGGSGQATVAVMVIDSQSSRSTLDSLDIVPFTADGGLSALPFGSRHTLSASVTTSGGPAPIVIWVVGGQTLGSVMAPPYEIEHTFATEGEITVEAIAVDQGGHTLRALQRVVVAPNAPPSVGIVNPLSGTEFEVGEVINLEVEASDPEGHDVGIAWFLNGTEPPVATGGSAGVSVTESGEYRLTARATDTYGAATEHTVMILVRATEEEALKPRIVSPQENQLVTAGDPVTFHAADVPVGATITWQSATANQTVTVGTTTRGSQDGAGELILTGALDEPGANTVTLFVQYGPEEPMVVAGTVAIVVNPSPSLDGIVPGNRSKVAEELAKHGVRDVNPNTQGAGSIVVLLEAGLLQPDEQGALNPDAPLEADEGIAIFAKVLGIASKTDSSETAFEKMRQAGLVSPGVSANAPMTRIEVARLISRALGIRPSFGIYPFTDDAGLTREEKGIITALYELGVMKGFVDGTFRPGSILTITEIAILIDRVLGGF